MQVSNLLPIFNMEMPMVVEQPVSSHHIEEYVHQVIENPEQMDVVLNSILTKQETDSEALAKCNEFLIVLFKEHQQHSNEMNECVCSFISKLPEDIFFELLKNYPSLSLQIFEYCDGKTSSFVFNYLTCINKEWRLILRHIFHSLDKSISAPGMTLQQTQAGQFLSLILTCLSNRQCKQWLKFCVENLSKDDLIFFVLAINQQRRFVVNVLVGTHGLNLTQKGLGPFIKGLVQQKNCPELVDCILKQILDKFYRRKAFNRVVNQFHRLNSETQVRILTLLSPSKKDEVFKQYCANLPFMASFMDGLFKHHLDFFQRQYNINHILNCIQKEKLAEFLSFLDKQESPIGPYLLICLVGDSFQDFIYAIPLELRSRLLSYGIADATTYQLLQVMLNSTERQTTLTQLMGFRIDHFSVDPMDSLTLNNCMETLQQVVKNKEMAETYASFLTSIPPVLIGVLAMNSKHRNMLLSLTNLLSDEQLKFLVVTLPPETIGSVLERFESSLKPKHLMEILESFSVEQLHSYVKFKTQRMKECDELFLVGDQELQNQLYEIKEEEFITFKYYVELENKKNSLFRLIQRSTSVDCQCLSRFLKQPQAANKLPQDLLLNWDKRITKLNSKRALFEGPHAFMTMTFKQLEKIVKDWPQEEEVDLTQTLYTQFWLIVREKTLPYLGISEHSALGITHPGELTLLGIRTNEDLAFLGISAQAQCHVETLIKKVADSLKIVSTTHFEMLWQIFVDVCDDKVDPMDVEKKHKVDSKRIVQELNLAKQDPHKVKEICLSLCRELVKFNHVSKQEQETLEQGCQNLEKCHASEILKNSEALFEQAFLVLKNQYPIFCLQRYLCKNPHLKRAWEKFHTLGCQSISALVNKKIVKQSSDFLRLADIASKL